MVTNFKNFIKRNEKYIPPVAIFGGFIVDTITLGRIDNFFGQLLLSFYLILIGLLIVLINSIDSGKIKKIYIINKRGFFDFILLFSFGNLFSGFTLFYFQSVGGFTNWLFIIILFGLLISTEYFKKYYNRMIIQLSVYYFAIFSYLIFLVPLVLKKVNVWVFLLSGVFSLGLFYLYLIVFQKYLKIRFIDAKNIVKGILSVFLLINIFYFLNIIPPVPISIKEIDVYHSVKRVKNNYEIVDEKKDLFDYFKMHKKIEIIKGKSLYAYSSIFSPSSIDFDVYHEWQYRDEKGKWQTISKVSYPLIGGSSNGYRGFSLFKISKEGKYRVNVETKSGQLIGRKVFNVNFVEKNEELITFNK